MITAPQLKVTMQGKTAVVEIYDDIGPSWAGMIDAKAVSRALAAAGEYESIEVRINSLGGSAFEGVAIHNLLKADPAPVTVRIDGIAASSASLIAMAGDTVIMPPSALMMIHEPWSIVMGGRDEFHKAVEMLDKVIESGAKIYADKSGKTTDEAKAWMSAETWLTGDEAVELGLADRTDGDLQMAVELREPGQSFRNAPHQFHELVAMSARKTTEGKTMPKPKAKADPKQTPISELVDEILESDDAAETPAAKTPNAETPASEAPVETPAGDPPAVDQRAELKTYMAAFGTEQGAKWFADGKPMAECQAAFTDQLKTENADLKTRLAGVQLGEKDPLSGGGADPESGRKGGVTKEKTVMQNKLGDRLGSYASTLKMPQPSAN